MTYPPDDLQQVRQYLRQRTGLSLNELGIVADPANAGVGGYHYGRDDLTRGYGPDLRKPDGRYEYSVRQSRDRSGLTNAASALDIGNFPNLRALSIALADACRASDPRTHSIREIIYSADGRTVTRYDAIGEQTGGDNSHLTHTHISFWRDTEGCRGELISLFGDILGDPAAGPTPAPDPTNWTEIIVNNLPTIQRGATGTPVKRLEGLLVAAGYPLPASTRNGLFDGTFGPEVEGKLKRYQADRHVTNSVTAAGTGDGVAGHHTWAALLGG